MSQVGFAGSVTTGDYVVCAGQVGVADHVHLGTGAVFGAKSGVHRDMAGGQTYLGLPAHPIDDTTKQWIALQRLPEIRQSVRQMTKTIEALEQRLRELEDNSDNQGRSATAA